MDTTHRLGDHRTPRTVGAAIALRHLSRSYEAGEYALEDLSLDVEPGELVTILGPSGAGKTTVLRLLAGLEFPDRGTIHVEDEDITWFKPQARNIGVVFQDYALFPHMTVAENCAFALRVRKEPRDVIAKRVSRSLAQVQLEAFAERYPAQLSGGQKQRVAIARTLVFQPRVLLMDEPLGALDKQLREHMQLELRQLQQRLQTTCVYVTHDQEEAMGISDRIAVLRGGRLEQVGSPSELYEEPASRFVADFFGRMNFLEGARLREEDDEVIVETEIGQLAARRSKTTGPSLQRDITVAVRPERVTVLDTGAPAAEEHAIKVSIESARYAGATTYLEGITDSGCRLTACSNERDGYAVGDRVVFAFKKRDALALPQES